MGVTEEKKMVGRSMFLGGVLGLFIGVALTMAGMGIFERLDIITIVYN